MGALEVYKTVLKYDLKSFLGYIRAKSSRVAGFIIGLVLLVLYILATHAVFSIPEVKEVLQEFQEEIRTGIQILIFTLMIFALSGGFSIITSVRKGQRAIINLLLSSPTNPKDVFRTVLINNSLAVTLLIMIIAYPPIIEILLAAGFSILQVILFSINLLIGIIAFASVGAALGVFYVKLSIRQKLVIWSTLAIFAGFVYVSVLSFEPTTLSALQHFSKILSSVISPFRWYSSPLYLATNPTEYVLLALSLGLSVSLIEGTSSILQRKYITGAIKSPEERIIVKYTPRKGLICRLYGQEVRGLFRKELRMITREPAVVSSIIFTYVIFIFMLLMYSNISVDGNVTPEMLQFMRAYMFLVISSAISVISPMTIISTAMAMERKNLALLLSSPIDPTKIIRAKSLVSDIIVGITIVLLIPMSIMSLGMQIASIIILYVVIIALITTGLTVNIVVRWTDYKADNPRKALKWTGTIVVMAMLFVIIIINSFMGFVVLSALEYFTYIIIASVGALVGSFFARRKLFKLAGMYLGRMEATEYL
ncbi:MAG: hypothetical protein NDP13_06430 [Crenarchaeota archaeon]|nr:hypothetical protein [Thermoproteota archaeon]MCR8455572.1 hypothetical protein [Thermoproteota archaeon]MCR8501634.1 hypothetical protein [Thermoproteota archaeon]